MEPERLRTRDETLWGERGQWGESSESGELGGVYVCLTVPPTRPTRLTCPTLPIRVS